MIDCILVQTWNETDVSLKTDYLMKMLRARMGDAVSFMRVRDHDAGTDNIYVEHVSGQYSLVVRPLRREPTDRHRGRDRHES